MNIRFWIFIFIFTSSLTAQKMDDLEWLEGEWVNYTQEDSSYEVWTKTGSGFDGYGLTIINGDTAFYEELKIIEEGENIYYQARIEDQNEGKPILFKYISRPPDHIFLNRDHDFPQKIIYTPVNDTLYIKLEGIEDNYEKRIDLFFIKK